jgi:hypothetical protein
LIPGKGWQSPAFSGFLHATTGIWRIIMNFPSTDRIAYDLVPFACWGAIAIVGLVILAAP